MTLVLRLVPQQQGYLPGDLVTATLEVACRSARQVGAGTGVQLASVWVEAVGMERVDSSWVAAGYAADVPVSMRQGRHLQRHLFHVHSRPVLQHALLTPGFSQRFAIRLKLPEALPPSFKGTAVMYSYQLEAHARFATALVMPPHQRQPSGSSMGSDSMQANGRVPSAEVQRKPPQGQLQLQQRIARVSLKVWPQAQPADRRGAASSPAAADDEHLPAALHYNVPSNDLAVEIKAASPDDAPADAASPGGAARLMHAASQPAMLDGMLRGSRQEASGNSTTRRVSAADTPSHGREPPPLLRSYNLRMGDAPLVRLAVHQQPEGLLQRGALLACTLDFQAGRKAAAGGAAPRCTEVLVLLETEEVVAERWRPVQRPGSGVIRKARMDASVWDEWSELTQDTMLTHFQFSMPLNAPSSFVTPAVRLQWLLRFCFTAQPPAPVSGGGWGLRLGGSASPAPEQITWTLPLTVQPPGAPA